MTWYTQRRLVWSQGDKLSDCHCSRAHELITQGLANQCWNDTGLRPEPAPEIGSGYIGAANKQTCHQLFLRCVPPRQDCPHGLLLGEGRHSGATPLPHLGVSPQGWEQLQSHETVNIFLEIPSYPTSFGSTSVMSQDRTAPQQSQVCERAVYVNREVGFLRHRFLHLTDFY